MERIAMERRLPIGLSSRLLVGLPILLLLGCSAGKLGNFDTPESSGSGNKLTELLGLGKTDAASQADAQNRGLTCPELRVLDGTEVARFHAGSPPSSTNLRVQYSIEDTARECSTGSDKLVVKVGIAGKVLLGPAGSPGSFTVPVRVAVVRNSDQSTLASKLYRASATITGKRTEESFTIISEPISVPFVHARAEEDYTIKVGIDSANAPERAEGESRRR